MVGLKVRKKLAQWKKCLHICGQIVNLRDNGKPRINKGDTINLNQYFTVL
jgi:hypothetical protein